MNVIFPQVLSEILWLMMLLLGAFSVKFLRGLAESLDVLTDLMEKVTENIKNHELRIKELENK